MEIREIIEICEMINAREERISMDEIVLTLCKKIQEMEERIEHLEVNVDEHYD